MNPDQYQNAITFFAYTALILGGRHGARPGRRLDAPAVPVQFADTGLRGLSATGSSRRPCCSQTDIAPIRFVLSASG